MSQRRKYDEVTVELHLRVDHMLDDGSLECHLEEAIDSMDQQPPNIILMRGATVKSREESFR